MDLISDFVALVMTAATALLAPQVAPLERRVERSFHVASGSTVAVELSGGRITVVPGSGDTSTIRLVQRVHVTTEQAADAALTDYLVTFAQTTAGVHVEARRKPGLNVDPWRAPRVNIDAEVTVPPNVRLDLRTSGGSITVQGVHRAPIAARTSGGSITLDEAHAPVDVRTSGGSIRVAHAGGSLLARTSGGSIRIGEVSAAAETIDVRTSGGSISLGVAPSARLDIDASTSGGRVSVDDLPLLASQRSNHHVTGRLNGGGGSLRASTSGGSVRISGTGPTGVR
jgi:Putative adhesin